MAKYTVNRLNVTLIGMSAKVHTASQRHSINVPSLPPELWLQIFRFAIWTPEINPSEICSEREQLANSTKANRNRLRFSLATKCHLVRVCRQWYSLASPFLYEHIAIRRKRTLSSLCRTLLESKRRTTDDRHPLGWWTKRLDVIVGGDNLLLPDAIRCFHNLAIVNVNVNPYSDNTLRPTSVLQSLVDTCRHSLRVIIWPTLIPLLDDWQLFIAAACNKLQVIHCPYASLPGFPVFPSLVSIAFNSWNCPGLQNPRTVNPFPSLRKIVCQGRELDPSQTDEEQFLRLYGHRLTTALLVNSHMPTQLRELTQFCPQLRRLDICVCDWEEFKPNLVLLHITHLGLRSRELQTTSRKYRQFFSALGTLEAGALKVVQLTDYRTVTDLRVRHARVLAEGIALLKSRNLSLEDADGCVLY